MTTLMKAREAADQVYEAIKLQVAQWKEKGIQPKLAAVLVEGDPASAYYAHTKQKVAEKLGISYQLYAFSRTVQEQEIVELIAALNADHEVHGIMLELPLPSHISTTAIEALIAPSKDIDGVTPSNKLANMIGSTGLYPATPQACIRLLKHYGYALEGRNVTLVGRGQTVGLPLFHMLQRENATVTVCHSRTSDLASHLQHADIAFVAVGHPNVVKQASVHADLVVIDVGINENEQGAIVGDVSQDAAGSVAAISPVPGGVGTLTTAVLFENLLHAIKLQLNKEVS